MSWRDGNFRGRFARSSDSLPLARTDDLVIEDLAVDGEVDEVLVYDQRTDQAHCLTRDAAMVWRVCDGKTSPAELAVALSLDIDVVTRALEELAECGLLDAGPVTGITRREATIRMAKVGGLAAAAPMIYSILAPTPALAASQNFCLKLSDCNSAYSVSGCGFCHQNGCACCGVSSPTIPGVKLCTADCSTTNCSPQVALSHCGGTLLSTTTCNT